MANENLRDSWGDSRPIHGHLLSCGGLAGHFFFEESEWFMYKLLALSSGLMNLVLISLDDPKPLGLGNELGIL